MPNEAPAAVPAIVTATTPDRWFALIERVLTTPDLPVDALERVVAIFREERQGAALEEFNNALAGAQAEAKRLLRDKPNAAFRSRYASHEAVADEMQPIREKYGFGWLVSQAPAQNPLTHIRYTGTLSKGRIEKTVYLEVRITPLEGPKGGRVAMTPIQETGSNTTYMRRYLAMLAFDLVVSDDPLDNDGNSTIEQPGNGDTQPPARKTGLAYPPPQESAAEEMARLQRQEDAKKAQAEDVAKAFRQAQVAAAQAKIDGKPETTETNGNGNGKPDVWDGWLTRVEETVRRCKTRDDYDSFIARPNMLEAQRRLAKEGKPEQRARFSQILAQAAQYFGTGG